MRRRPLACLMLLLFLILQLIPADRMIRSAGIVEKCKGQVTGTVTYRQHQKENMQLTLADCQIESGGSVQHADQLLVTLTDDTEYPVGSVLSLSGTVYPIEEKRNPGQFDGKLYYGAKKIAGTVYGENVHILTVHPSPVRESLLQLKKRLSDVYESAADEKTAGLLKSMILGDKSSLDAEIKELYQENGIAHVLAISGVKTLKLDIPLVPETSIKWALMPLHIAKIYILKLCLDEEIIPRCRFPCSRGYLTKCINQQKKQ